METVQPAINETFIKTIEELRTYEKKNLRINRVKLTLTAIAAVLIVLIAVLLSTYVGKITHDINDLSATMTEAGNNINVVAEDLQKIDFELLGSSVQAFAQTGTETIDQIKESTQGLDQVLSDAQTAMQNLSSIDIRKLNESIQELHDVLEPVANFFNIFH